MPSTKLKTSLSDAGELARLKRELKEKDSKLRDKDTKAIESKFVYLEEKVNEALSIAQSAMKQAAMEHRCSKPHDFMLIDQSFKDGKEEFNSIWRKLEAMSSRSFWSIVGGISAVVLAGLIATYHYGRNESKWEQTTDRVQKVEVSAAKIEENVGGLKLSFGLMEQKLEAVPEKLKEAVREGMKKK
jgi:hypothetical protein